VDPRPRIDRASLPDEPASRAQRVRELVRLFFWLGITAFGGPAVHIALMEDAIVQRQRWMTRERFLNLLGITNLLPGPNSTEMAMHIGHVRAGGLGLVAAGSAFILPAAVMSGVLAWVYVRYGLSPPVIGILYGLKPVVVAVVLQALWRLGQSALRTPALIAVAVGALALSALEVHELIVLVAAGTAHLALKAWRRPRAHADSTLSIVPFSAPAASGVAKVAKVAKVANVTNVASTAVAAAGVAAAAPSLLQLFLVFLKIGSVLFGSGYVLLMFLRADVVQRYHWITEAQLIDAIAIGQIVPGPVLTASTFIGYLIAGPAGAAVATLGIFLPAFCFVGVSGRLVDLVERSPLLQAFLDGVIAGSLALIAIVTWQLGRAALVDPLTMGIAAASAVALVWYRVNPVWPVLIAALVGIISRLVMLPRLLP
jgi:chromate transporter